MRKRLSLLIAIVMTFLCLTGCGSFKTDTLVKAAKANGIKEITIEDYLQRNGAASYDPMNPIEYAFYNDPVYFRSKERSDAVRAFNRINGISSNVSYLREFAECEYRNTGIMLIIADNENAAKRFYDEYLEIIEPEKDRTKTGNKSGYTYTIAYYPSENDPGSTEYYGLYLKGDSFLFISSDVDAKHGSELMEYYCKKLGVISPLTLVK